MEEEQKQEERGEWYLAKQIAAGILIAAAVIFVGFHLYAALVARAASKAAHEVVQQAQQELQQQLDRNAAGRRARAEAQRIEGERQAAAELARRHEVARQEQAAADQARLEQASRAAKEQAWQQFYKPARKCEEPADWDTQVECGNAHIKAKREFEDRWARGDI